MPDERKKRLLLIAAEGATFFILTGIMVPLVGRGPWSLMIASYVLIQALNMGAFHRGLALSHKTIERYLEVWGHETSQEELQRLLKAQHAATFDSFNIYSPVDGLRVWWVNRRVWRKMCKATEGVSNTYN